MDSADLAQILISGKNGKNSPPVKVHGLICSELTKIIEKINFIIPQLESARPGSTAGIKQLCTLNNSVDKCRLIIQHCSECSKLYLALTGSAILSRCERTRNSLNESLYLIQDMVHPALAAQVKEVIDFLKNTKFIIHPREEEAGRVIQKLLSQTDSTEQIESKTLQFAASKLDLVSPKSILGERRSIKNLISKINGTDPKKEEVLNFLLCLLNTYGKNLRPDSVIEFSSTEFDEQDEGQIGKFGAITPQNESNYYSISSLADVSLNLLEGKKARDFGNISRIPSDSGHEDQSENFSRILFPWSEDYKKFESFCNFNSQIFFNFFKSLSELQFENQRKAIEEIKLILERDVETCFVMLNNGFEEGLIDFLKKSRDLSDNKAQNIGAQLFLAFLSNNRVEFPSLSEEVLQLLIPFVNTEMTEALSILVKFCHYLNFTDFLSPKNQLKSEDAQILELSMQILCDTSSLNGTKSHTVLDRYGYIKVLTSILSDEKLTELCLKFMQNLSYLDESTEIIHKNRRLLSCLVELLETGTPDERDYSISILYNICSKEQKICIIIMEEGVISSLVDLSINGSEEGKELSIKLLQILRDIKVGPTDQSMEDQSPILRSSKVYLRKTRIFSRFRSPALY